MSDDTPLEDRTEEPSEKRKDQFREDGRVAKSQDLVSAFMLLGSGASLIILSDSSSSLMTLLVGFWGHLDEGGSWIGQPDALLAALAIPVVKTLFPVFLLLAVTGLAAHMMQTGPLLAWKAVQPKPSKLNPVSGIKRIFASPETYFNLVKTVGKVFFIAVVASLTIWMEGADWITTVRFPIAETGRYIHRMAIWTLFSAGLAMLVIGGVDFAWQYHRTHRQMKMTKEEAKKEYKENEGDPLIKGRRKMKHRELISMNRLLDEVPRADVIINNPTHVSVAVRYGSGDGTPIVVAKGVDEVALRIRQVAQENSVPMVTNIALARALHKNVKTGDHISEEFFKAVAEVLVFVWKHHGRKG